MQVANSKLILATALFVISTLTMLNARATGSAFLPSTHSAVKSGLLMPNPAYDPPNFQPEKNGLSHPFTSPSSVFSAVKEVFTSQSAEHDLFSYRHPNLLADVNVYAGYESDHGDPGDYGFWYKGWKLSARAWDNFHLRTDWYNGAFYGDLDAAEADPLIDGYYKRFNRHIQLDNLNGELAWKNQDITLALGRGRFQIGNSISGSIILNDQVNDYGYLKAEAALGDFRMSLLHASLMADSTYSIHNNNQIDQRQYPDKFLALHQLSYFPTSALELFIGETVVYGNRSLDINYLLPNSFWRATEHNLWDRDNVMIYAGGNLALGKSTKLYAQFALDEFSYGKIFTNWWGNKYAVQAGAEQYLPNLRLVAEITAVRPYTYAHFMNHTMYSHDASPLGFPQGSNVMDISLEANVIPLPFIQIDSRISYRHRGSDGNSWQDNYHDIFAGEIDTATTEWFAGSKSDEYQFISSLAIPLWGHHKLLMGHDSIRTDGWMHKLFAAWQFIY